MKILWAKSDFLHPTERGGQIRTIETLRALHREHEVHYAAYVNPAHPEAVKQAAEYAAQVYAVPHPVPPGQRLAFAMHGVRNLWDTLPFSIARYESGPMKRQLAELMSRNDYDAVVCDFLAMAPNFADLSQVVLFQHNVEYTIWQRHVQHAADPIRRYYFNMQYERTRDYERRACQQAGHVIAVSDVDRDLMESQFGMKGISVVPTGVDVDYFKPPEQSQPDADLVFVGAMDWMPNIDGVRYFVSEILPLIRRERPECSLVVVGRSPGPAIRSLTSDPLIRVTGTVPDVRKYLWNASVSIVPLRIGGGTRLKIYESMAAGRPVVSTRVGAEGLPVEDGRNVALADTPETFAAACLALLKDRDLWRARQTEASHFVRQFSWQAIGEGFAGILGRWSEKQRSLVNR